MSGEHKIHPFLAKLPLFGELQSAEIDRIAAGTKVLRVARGETLFRRGDAADGFFIVAFGQIKLAFTSAQGVEKVVQLMGPGESFGEAVMFLSKPYMVFSQAIVDSLVLHVGKDAVFCELERNPVFARKMLAGLSMRLHSLVQDVESYSLRSSAQRVIGYLLQHEQPDGSGERAYCIQLPASKVVIASRLNITPETFSRVLRDLSEAGLISVSGKRVIVLDVEGLRSHM